MYSLCAYLYYEALLKFIFDRSHGGRGLGRLGPSPSNQSLHNNFMNLVTVIDRSTSRTTSTLTRPAEVTSDSVVSLNVEKSFHTLPRAKLERKYNTLKSRLIFDVSCCLQFGKHMFVSYRIPLISSNWTGRQSLSGPELIACRCRNNQIQFVPTKTTPIK